MNNVNLKNFRVLACFAHPDDEAFPVGGTLSLYSSQGADIALLTTTSGQLGEIREEGIATEANLGEIRRQELRNSCSTLGINRLTILEYKDSGMDGWEANSHPEAFINAKPSVVQSQLVQEIRFFKPHILLTFEPTGLYGHPDHISISNHVTKAFHKSSNKEYVVTKDGADLPIWKVSKLLHCARPLGYRKLWYDMLKANNIDMPEPSPEQLTHGTPVGEIDFQINIKSALDTKIKSILCHRTQTGPNWPYKNAPQTVKENILGIEHYIQVIPKLPPGSIKPSHFYDGIKFQ
jgi:N-acetyl-1-D-myo-inositol-2-amino-2-deoxy-alpha-D-glucopyranoside deacetylase